MKIAVFSDIHGNLQALNTVLEQIRAKNADLTVFLGDIFQRGNQPDCYAAQHREENRKQKRNVTVHGATSRK